MLAGMKPNRLWLAPVLLAAVLVSSPGPCANAGTVTSFKGIYNGLMYPEGELDPEQCGYFTIKASANGYFTGKLLVGSRRASFHGKFDDQGEATVNVWLVTVKIVDCGSCSPPISVEEKKRTLTWTLDLQLVKDGEQITGQVFHRRGERWIAVLSGDRAGFALTNPAPQAGQYTFILPGNVETTNSPNGHGSGTFTVDASGKVVLKGVLADGAIISQSAVLSKDGIWPFFVPLHKGKGMLLAWMTFTNLPETDLVGTVTWIKPARPGAQFYPLGFTNDMMVVASHYAPASPVLDLTNGIVVFRGESLGSPLTNSVTLEAGSVIANRSGNSVTLTVAATSGLFKGKVQELTATRIIRFRGAVLQNQNAAFGYFLDAGRSGEVFLGSSPEAGH